MYLTIYVLTCVCVCGGGGGGGEGPLDSEEVRSTVECEIEKHTIPSVLFHRLYMVIVHPLP